MIDCGSDIHMKMPYSVTREKDTTHYTYLDTVGRPVITLQKDNLVEQHILDFEVTSQSVWFSLFVDYSFIETISPSIRRPVPDVCSADKDKLRRS